AGRELAGADERSEAAAVTGAVRRDLQRALGRRCRAPGQLVRGNEAERVQKPVHGLRRSLLAYRDHVFHRGSSILAPALSHGAERTITLVLVPIGDQKLLR